MADIYGTSENDTLQGTPDNDTLYGYEGNDVLIGGSGNDTFYGGVGSDRINLIGSANVANGNEDSDIIVNVIGNNNLIHGNEGNDQLSNSSTGNGALFFGDSGDDRIVMNAGSGTATVYGGDGNDYMADLSSGAIFYGGTGDDRYELGSASVVFEAANEGVDTVAIIAPLMSYTLQANFENLTMYQTSLTLLTGIGNESANTIDGNSLDNVIDGMGGDDTLVGNEGADTLNGGDGSDVLIGDSSNGSQYSSFADVLIGGAGNDTYLVTDNVDSIIEHAGEGTDLVQSYLDYTLGANLENLALVDNLYAVHGTGNELNNIITANQGNNVLDGAAGADTLKGGSGNDTYYVDNAADKVVELIGDQGADTVFSTVNFTLANYVENLTLTGAVATNAIGNSLNNILTGNALNNTLRGYNGTDLMYGNDGNDNLYGGNQNDTLYGGAGNDLLNGESGNDRMEGGAGNDTYMVDVFYGDYIVELENEGTDTVKVSGTDFDLGTTPWVENLSFTRATNNAGTGNTLANILTGNAGNDLLYGYNGNDTLNGAAGNDTLIGGGDNDTYYVDSAGDVVLEYADNADGIDTVRASISYTLAASVEKLILTGDAVSGTGNNLNNTINGTVQDNILAGGTGADTLAGGAGNDIYLLARGDGADRISDASGDNDIIRFAADVAHEQLWFRAAGTALEIKVIGTTDKFTVLNWFSNDAYRVESIESGNGKILDASAVQLLVDAMAALPQPSLGQLALNATQHTQLDPVIAAAWQLP